MICFTQIPSHSSQAQPYSSYQRRTHGRNTSTCTTTNCVPFFTPQKIQASGFPPRLHSTRKKPHGGRIIWTESTEKSPFLPPNRWNYALKFIPWSGISIKKSICRDFCGFYIFLRYFIILDFGWPQFYRFSDHVDHYGKLGAKFVSTSISSQPCDKSSFQKFYLVVVALSSFFQLHRNLGQIGNTEGEKDIIKTEMPYNFP